MTTDMQLRLNLGGGDVEVEGFTNVDRQHGQEAYPLAYGEETIAEIRASHLLEHFPYGQVQEVLKHWVSRLYPSGLLRIAVPDFRWIAERFLANEPINVQGYTMGGQCHENDFHRTVFDEALLKELMINVGLERIGRWKTEAQDCARLPVSLNLQGFKPSRGTNPANNVRASLSCPRFGPTIHQRCTSKAFGRAHIPYNVANGAYWHQVLSMLLEDAIKGKAEFVFAVDYDSIFDYEDVLELCRLIRADTAADAVCPMQSKRGGKTTLVGMADRHGIPRTKVYVAEFDQNLTQIHRGHFGLTIFRVESLANHPRPWMIPIPDSDGCWGEGRIDADINFWDRWRDSGKTLYLANHVVIGHMEEVISWPTRDFTPIYQDIGDYDRNGIPAEVKR